MHKLLIAAVLAAATATPVFATTTDSIPIPAFEHQSMQMPNLPQDARASDTGINSAPEAAPIVEARRMQRR